MLASDPMLYSDGPEILVGDRVIHHATAHAIVEEVIGAEGSEGWGIDGPGFLILCERCGRILVEPGSAEWEDVAFLRRGG